jgi:hypothetical protein
MKNGLRRVLGVAFTDRGIYLPVVLNLCFVASVVGQTPFEGHGVASCVAPKEEAFFGCHFPPPPPMWKVIGVVLNAPPLLASAFLSERLEEAYPRLCGLMTSFNLLTLAAGVWLQWTAASLATGSLIEAVRVKSRRA